MSLEEQQELEESYVMHTFGRKPVEFVRGSGMVLEDDKGFFPSYLCGNVVRNEVLSEHPELEEIFAKLTGTITDADMAAMNYAVETEGAEPRDVAMDFLRERGLLNEEE